MGQAISVGATRDILNPNSVTFEERAAQLKTEDEQEKQKREQLKKSPYASFLQVNKDAYKAEDWLMSKSPIAYRIFKFLMNNMDGYNAVICSYQVLEEYFNVSKPTVTRAVKLLKEKQYVDIYKSGTSNLYTINKHIAWTSWGTNYQYAKFGTNIIISESEQQHIRLKTVKNKEITIKEQ